MKITALGTGEKGQQPDDSRLLHVRTGYYFYHGSVANDEEMLIASHEEGLSSSIITSLGLVGLSSIGHYRNHGLS